MNNWRDLSDETFDKLITSKNPYTGSFTIGVKNGSNFYYQTPYHIENNLYMTQSSYAVNIHAIATFLNQDGSTTVDLYFADVDVVLARLRAIYNGNSETLTFTYFAYIGINLSPIISIMCSYDGECVFVYGYGSSSNSYVVQAVYTDYYDSGQTLNSRLNVNEIKSMTMFSGNVYNSNYILNFVGIVMMVDNNRVIKYIMPTINTNNKAIRIYESRNASLSEYPEMFIGQMSMLKKDDYYYIYYTTNKDNSILYYSKITSTELQNGNAYVVNVYDTEMIPNYLMLLDSSNDLLSIFSNNGKSNGYYYGITNPYIFNSLDTLVYKYYLDEKFKCMVTNYSGNIIFVINEDNYGKYYVK